MAKYENKPPYQPPCGKKVGDEETFHCDCFIVRRIYYPTIHEEIRRIDKARCISLRSQKYGCFKNCPPEAKS